MKKPIPEGYQHVIPYLIVKDAEGLMNFMKKVFDAEEKMKYLRDEKTIMHAEVKIGDSTVMFAEATDEWKTQPAGMFVYVDDADEVYLKALQQGATSLREPADMDYGRGGGVQDPYGNTWWMTSVL
jgi:uncharacterized glyoxalase superfamily protein PhnB